MTVTRYPKVHQDYPQQEPIDRETPTKLAHGSIEKDTAPVQVRNGLQASTYEGVKSNTQNTIASMAAQADGDQIHQNTNIPTQSVAQIMGTKPAPGTSTELQFKAQALDTAAVEGHSSPQQVTVFASQSGGRINIQILTDAERLSDGSRVQYFLNGLAADKAEGGNQVLKTLDGDWRESTHRSGFRGSHKIATKVAYDGKVLRFERVDTQKTPLRGERFNYEQKSVVTLEISPDLKTVGEGRVRIERTEGKGKERQTQVQFDTRFGDFAAPLSGNL